MSDYFGMDPTTGRRLDGLEHIRASFWRILTTPIGSRVERRPFGSLLPDLVDQPNNQATRLRVIAASAGALTQWEPRIKLTKMTASYGSNTAQLSISVYGVRIDGPRPQSFALELSIPITAKRT